jgi:hypothetical protein
MWVASASFAQEWRPSNALLRAVKHVESNNGRQLYGDSGRSLGAFQISEGAWADVSAYRRARGQKVYSYDQHVMHGFINQAYAADYLAIIHAELSSKLRRTPTPGELYAAYNMGLANFAECKYRMANVNPVTARKARQIHQLMAKDG